LKNDLINLAKSELTDGSAMADNDNDNDYNHNHNHNDDSIQISKSTINKLNTTDNDNKINGINTSNSSIHIKDNLK